MIGRRPLLALLALVVPSVALGQERPDERATREPPIVHEEGKVHFVGLRYDVGKASAYGVGYLHAHESRTSRGGLGFIGYLGYGFDVRMITRDHDAIDALLASAVFRMSGLADAGGSALEVALGAGQGDEGIQGAGHVGVFFEVYFFGLGYSFQFPLGPFSRTRWLSGHQFGIRVQIPVHRWDTRRWEEEAPE